jgi:hypothetical protein
VAGSTTQTFGCTLLPVPASVELTATSSGPEAPGAPSSIVSVLCVVTSTSSWSCTLRTLPSPCFASTRRAVGSSVPPALTFTISTSPSAPLDSGTAKLIRCMPLTPSGISDTVNCFGMTGVGSSITPASCE